MLQSVCMCWNCPVAKCLYVLELPDLLCIFPIAWANIRIAFWPAHNWKRVTWCHHNKLTRQTCNVHITKFCNMLPFFSMLDKPSTPLPAENPACHSYHIQAIVWTPNLHINFQKSKQDNERFSTFVKLQCFSDQQTKLAFEMANPTNGTLHLFFIR